MTAELISACDAFFSEWTEDQKDCDANVMRVKSGDAIAKCHANLDRISAIPAKDIAGMRAKIRVIRCLDYDNQRLVASLCDDLTEYRTV